MKNNFKLETAICSKCKQEIILLDNGCFVRHNKPNSWQKIDDITFIPIKCKGSYQKPIYN